MITLLILLPILSGLALLSAKGLRTLARPLSLIVNFVILAFVIFFALRTRGAAGFSTDTIYAWLPAIGLQYRLAVDGISAVFLVLTSIVFLMSIVASAQSSLADARYFGLLLLLEGGLLGTFTAQNFLHFFLFWELSLIPAFFIVRLYGGAHRAAASIQFFVYTMVGSIAMLLGFLALYLATGSFDLAELARSRPAQGFGPLLAQKLNWSGLAPATLGTVVFLLAFLGVAVKVPLWPLHSWLPAAYTQAPTPATMVLTGVMSKMGVYGLVRLILPIFPEQIERLHAPLLALAVITILYGALAALAQRDIKRLFAYSSLSHLGYCFLGVFAAAKAGVPGLENERAAAVNGVLLQVLSHGIIAAALFGFVSFLERRTGGQLEYENFGGLRKVNPVFAGLMGIAVFSSLGLPGLSGFPAEFLIFKGAFSFAPAAAAFAVLGLLFTAVYLLTFYGRVFLGPLNASRSAMADLTGPEKAIVLPALAISFALGFAPQLLLAICNPAVTALVTQMKF
jgi:NADH-quinone oxidoreductase subunit M